MSVTLQTPYNIATGNNVSTVFPYQFLILAATDLSVYIDGAIKINVADYTVSGVGVSGGGNVNFVTPPATGLAVSLIRVMRRERLTDYQQLGDFLTSVVNPDFDRSILISQDAAVQLQRSIRSPASEVSASFTLPAASVRASTYLTFDASGNVSLAVTLPSGTLSQASIGLFLYPRTAAEIAAGVTPTDYAYDPGDVRRYGADPTGAADSTTAITNADLVGSVSGQPVLFPAGVFRCNTGFVKKSAVNWLGSGKGSNNGTSLSNATILKYYGNTVFINAVGTSPARIICTIKDMRLDGTNAAANTECLKLGWNQRSNPFLQSVHIYNWSGTGLHFTDQNWNIDFNDVEIDTCGTSAANGTGIFKDAAVDASTFNGITFNNLQVESCGNATSTAGGICMLTTTANRGLYFNNSIVEGNLGTLQIYITKMSDLQFKNLYMEGIVAAGQTAMCQFDGCTGGVNGGYLTGSGGATAQVGIAAKLASEMQVDAVTFASFATAAVDIYGSTVRLGHNPGVTIRLDATAQLIGEIAPRFGAHKNGTNQVGIVTAVFTKVTFGTKEFDETGAFDAVTNNRFTPQAVGRYQIDTAVTWVTAVDATQLDISIYRNGASYKAAHAWAKTAATQTLVLSALVDSRNTTDYFEIFVRQQSGANKDISGATDETYLMATLVR